MGGVPCAAGHRNLKKLRESIEAKVGLITRPVANAMLFLLDAVKSFDQQIGQLNKTLKELVMSDERGRLLPELRKRLALDCFLSRSCFQKVFSLMRTARLMGAP